MAIGNESSDFRAASSDEERRAAAMAQTAEAQKQIAAGVETIDRRGRQGLMRGIEEQREARGGPPVEARQPPMTKAQEAQAAVAMMKQAEGKPLSDDEAEAANLWQLSGQMRDLAGQRTAVRVANPLYDERKAHTEQTEQAQGQILGGRVNEYSAALEHERNLESFRKRVATEDQMVMVGMQAKEQVRQDAMDDEARAVQESGRIVRDSAAAFQRTPGVDPNRYWASRTAGQKFGAVMLGIAKGFLKQDPVGHIRAAIAEDIEAQEANIGLAQQKYGVNADAFQSQRNVYQDIRSNVEDKRTADLIYERSRMQQAESEFQWWMQKGKVSQMNAGQQAFLGEIQQAQADLELQIAERTHNNPRQYTRVVRNPNAKALNARADKLEDLSIDMQKETQKQRGTMALEGAKAKFAADGGMTEGDKTRSWDQRKWLAEKVTPRRLELDAIKKFKEEYKDEIPGVNEGGVLGRAAAGAAAGGSVLGAAGAIVGGVGAALWGDKLTSRQRDAKAKMVRLVFLRLRPESGAAIPDSEIMRDAEQAVEAMSETDVRNWLHNREQEAGEYIDLMERAPDQTEVESIRRAPVQERRAITDQVGVRDPVAVD